MIRDHFIQKWLGNPDKQYTEQFRDEMRDDLDKVIEYTIHTTCPPFQYTDKDLQEFAEWYSVKGFEFNPEEKQWDNMYNSKYFDKVFTTSDLQLEWEVETGRREK